MSKRQSLLLISALLLLFISLYVAIVSSVFAASDTLLGPGDSRDGYEDSDYKTNSRSLEQRKGRKLDLYALVKNPPLGLPAVPSPEDNPFSREGIELGRRLFFDRRLSLNDTMSCAICHVPEMGFAHNELQAAIGFEGSSTRRNAPTLLNVAYKSRLFHEGRETLLENQVWSPLLAHNEMANPSIGYVLDKINRIKDYDGLFEKAFGKKPTMELVGKALAQYERALVSGDSPFDRWHYKNDKRALNAEEKAGFEIFVGKGRCSACHLIEKESAYFSDNLWHNTGIGYRESMQILPEKTEVQLAPGVFTKIDSAVIEAVTQQKKENDIGLYEVTQNPNDRWKYITPTLRNVALTAPYMHNGSISTLEGIVDFYDKGGVPNDLLDPLITPLGLSAKEKSDLVAFLHALTGNNVEDLVADAFVAPVGDLGEDDPFWSNEYFRDKK